MRPQVILIVHENTLPDVHLSRLLLGLIARERHAPEPPETPKEPPPMIPQYELRYESVREMYTARIPEKHERPQGAQKPRRIDPHRFRK